MQKRKSMYILILLSSLLLLADCNNNKDSIFVPQMEKQPLQIKYLALGDGYTSGEQVTFSQSWPIQLADSLIQTGFIIEGPTVVAHKSWTAADLKVGILHAKLDSDFDLVFLMIGVMDQYNKYNVEDYRIEFRKLLVKVSDLAQGDEGHVIVLSIPDWGATPFGSYDPQGIAIQIDQFNEVIQQETSLTRAHYVDITEISRRAANDRSLISIDGLFPSEKMYREWVKLLRPMVIRIFE